MVGRNLETRAERRARKRQERGLEQRGGKRPSWIQWAGGSLLVVGGLIWWAASRPAAPASDVLARNGLHWHPQLTMTIQGQDVPLDTNIGLGAVHNPMHTHDDTPIVHLEYQGRVTNDDLRLGMFFKAWGKEFSSTCILDSCNGPDGTVHMTVNGQPNAEFDRYVMRDKDQIEIIYE
ncbi:MAG: hypothetical protein HY341_00960 [Candidatus Kerfeldbacteria bacterium]|nr:hypothetical protein [Candidatus Kerfeldbacteria bacterium]